jgi:uncharacterized protein
MENKTYYMNFLRMIFGEGKRPLAKMIFTGAGYFLYDTGTNKILECGKEIFDLINHLYNKDLNNAVAAFTTEYDEPKFLEVAEKIMTAVNTEKILLTKPAGQFGLSEHFHDIEETMNSGIKSITLEVTEQCNLRCGYCLYGNQFSQQRNHGQDHMSIDTAYQAIRFLKERSPGEDSAAVGFYGGEPLLRFPFIKKCVRFAREVMQGKKINFNITTNATLIDEEIADFLIKENFSVLVSIDGPREIHDKYRKDTKGRGSFKTVLSSLELLVEKHKRHGAGSVAINAVYNPPYTVEKLEAIHRFFAGQDWSPDVDVTLQYANYSSLKGLFRREDLKEEKHLTLWAMDEYKQSFQHSSSMVKEQLEKRFAKFMQRSILSEPMDCYTLNGCCVPGQRKNFVTTDGSLQACEKMFRDCPSIGHVDTGFDGDTIKKVYIDDYAEKSLPTCSRCWALRLCDVCYSHAYNEHGQLDLKQKHRHCYNTLKALEKFLGSFIALLAESPEGLDYLAEYEIT